MKPSVTTVATAMGPYKNIDSILLKIKIGSLITITHFT